MQTLTRSPALEADLTRAYYETHSDDYFEDTVNVDLSDLYKEFLPYVPGGGRILDAGSGSGRDTLALLNKGYKVEAFDTSPALAERSSRLTGVQTKIVRFQDFESPPRFDGIWACASLLHVPSNQLRDAVGRLLASLKPNGALYASVKYGHGERIARDGRLFLDLDEAAVTKLFACFSDVVIKKIWVSKGEGSLQGRHRWLNVIVVKRPDKAGAK